MQTALTAAKTVAANAAATQSEVDEAAAALNASISALVKVADVFTIVADPAAAAAIKGTSATFTVEAIGTDLTYQWQYQTATGSKWYNCTTATGEGYASASVTLLANKGCNGYKYRCVVTNGDGARLTSAQAVLTVTDPITVTTQPEDVTAARGSSATLTVAATSNLEESLTYQ